MVPFKCLQMQEGVIFAKRQTAPLLAFLISDSQVEDKGSLRHISKIGLTRDHAK